MHCICFRHCMTICLASTYFPICHLIKCYAQPPLPTPHFRWKVVKTYLLYSVHMLFDFWRGCHHWCLITHSEYVQLPVKWTNWKVMLWLLRISGNSLYCMLVRNKYGFYIAQWIHNNAVWAPNLVKFGWGIRNYGQYIFSSEWLIIMSNICLNIFKRVLHLTCSHLIYHLVHFGTSSTPYIS